MKIALNGALASHIHSGVETSIVNLARSLAKWGKEDYVFFTPPRFSAPDPAAEHFRTVRSSLPLHRRPLRILWEHLAFPVLARRENADLIHAPAYIAPLFTSLPVVLTVYDLMALEQARYCRWGNTAHYNLLLPRSISKAAGVIVPSEDTRRSILTHFGLDPRKVRVIRPGVKKIFRKFHDTEAFESVQRKYGLNGDFILFVGRLEPKKNIIGLLRAAYLLKKEGKLTFSVVIAGIQGWGCGEIFRAARQLALGEDVIFTGFVPDNDLACLYNMAKMLVMPSFHEGFGLPIAEAMACGLPVVCTDRGAAPETAGGAAVTVPPDRPGELAEAIRRVAEDGRLRAKLSEEGTAGAESLTWRRAASETEAFYGETLKGWNETG
ncbi:MAG: glycosyltransferase family 1 protein [Kiritimatiellia bacterium]